MEAEPVRFNHLLNTKVENGAQGLLKMRQAKVKLKKKQANKCVGNIGQTTVTGSV